MDGYTYYTSTRPWYAYYSSITSVVVQEGVRYVGQWAFPEMPALRTISLPASAAEIDTITAFGYSPNLTE